MFFFLKGDQIALLGSKVSEKRWRKLFTPLLRLPRGKTLKGYRDLGRSLIVHLAMGKQNGGYDGDREGGTHGRCWTAFFRQEKTKRESLGYGRKTRRIFQGLSPGEGTPSRTKSKYFRRYPLGKKRGKGSKREPWATSWLAKKESAKTPR